MSAREPLPNLSTEQVVDNFLNAVDDQLSGLGNEAPDDEIVKGTVEQHATASNEAQDKISNASAEGVKIINEKGMCNPLVTQCTSP